MRALRARRWQDWRVRRVVVPALVALAALVAAAPAGAQPATWTPREITVTVGAEKGFMLLADARSGHRWRWIRRPDARIARPLPVQQIPMNDIVNGPAGRMTVYVVGVAPGRTRGAVGYFAPGADAPSKRVAVTITVAAG